MKRNILMMRNLVTWSILTFVLIHCTKASADRVSDARKSRGSEISNMFTDLGISYPPKKIFLQGFKKEEQLEMWAANNEKDPMTLIKTYSICAASGNLGPKRTEGDYQVPEGFYKVSIFNPQSRFHLSLGINYPNASDSILGKKPLGGQIMIHGNCVSIGCIAITDEKIEEVYLPSWDSFSKYKNYPQVFIFPVRMTDKKMKDLEQVAKNNSNLFEFWQELKVGYDFFEKNRTIPRVSVSKKGRYVIQ